MVEKQSQTLDNIDVVSPQLYRMDSYSTYNAIHRIIHVQMVQSVCASVKSIIVFQYTANDGLARAIVLVSRECAPRAQV